MCIRDSAAAAQHHAIHRQRACDLRQRLGLPQGVHQPGEHLSLIHISVRQAEELVRSLTEQPAAAAQNVEDEDYPESYSRLVEQLEKFFSQEISIKRSKNGGGRIVIEFGDDKDIERFIERFSGRIK